MPPKPCPGCADLHAQLQQVQMAKTNALSLAYQNQARRDEAIKRGRLTFRQLRSVWQRFFEMKRRAEVAEAAARDAYERLAGKTTALDEQRTRAEAAEALAQYHMGTLCRLQSHPKLDVELIRLIDDRWTAAAEAQRGEGDE